MSQSKQRQFPLQIHIAALTHDNEIKHVRYLVNFKTLLPSQKDGCHPILSDFGNDQLSIRKIDENEKFLMKPLDSFSIEVKKPFQSQ